MAKNVPKQRRQSSQRRTAARGTARRLGFSDAEELQSSFAPKSIAILYRPDTTKAVREAKSLASWLLDRGYEVFFRPGQVLVKDCAAVSDRNLQSIDLVIALGGDGTYLRAVRMLKGRQTPILGVNMGNLGFLTATRFEDMYDSLEAALSGKMEFRARSMLRVELRRRGKLVVSHLALNDAVLERGANTHLINIGIYTEKKNLVAEVKADALIVASPTGSTAYNLAAGGPILHPAVRAMVVTPVCPHSLTSRPLIFPDDQRISFRMLTRERKSILTVDGMNREEITADDEIVIVRSDLDHFVIRKPQSNYFSLLREKLAFGQRD